MNDNEFDVIYVAAFIMGLITVALDLFIWRP
jgi:hypothetical protein